MILIDDNIFKQFGKSIDFSTLPINQDLLKHAELREYFEKYLILSFFAEKLNNIEPLQIFYNKYYWFTVFTKAYVNKFGKDDLNLRQEGFKILEEGEQYNDINWNEIEKISKMQINESLI